MASYQILGDPPTRQRLDQVLPDRPFAIHAFDGHTVWANTQALELAGLLHGKSLPPGNEIVMGADGTRHRRAARARGLHAGDGAPALGRAGEAGHHHRPRPGPAADTRAARRRPGHDRGRPRLVRPARHHLDPQHGRQPLPAGPAGGAGRCRPARTAAPACPSTSSPACRWTSCARSPPPCAPAAAPTA